VFRYDGWVEQLFWLDAIEIVRKIDDMRDQRGLDLPLVNTQIEIAEGDRVCFDGTGDQEPGSRQDGEVN
jgi:hypothetical protein